MLFAPVSGLRVVLCLCLFLVGAVVTLAYLEEAIWDALVWRDHAELFAWSWKLPAIEAEEVLMIIVPLLAVPQATHYVLDGFIWRMRGSGNKSSENDSIGHRV